MTKKLTIIVIAVAAVVLVVYGVLSVKKGSVVQKEENVTASTPAVVNANVPILITCPNTYNQAKLVDSKVYIGSSKEGHEAPMGKNGTYDLSKKAPNQQPYVMVCSYGAESILETPLPSSATGCTKNKSVLACS